MTNGAFISCVNRGECMRVYMSASVCTDVKKSGVLKKYVYISCYSFFFRITVELLISFFLRKDPVFELNMAGPIKPILTSYL